MSDAFSRIGSQVVPSLAQGIFPDRMNIVSRASLQDDFGGAYEGSSSTSYSSVPVSVEPEKQSGERVVVGEGLDTRQRYVLRFPAYQNGSRINLDDSVHKLVVLARGSEPEKTFVTYKPRDHSGGMWTVIGELA